MSESRTRTKPARIALYALATLLALTAAYAVKRILSEAIDGQLKKLRRIWAEDLPDFNRKARDADVPAVIVETPKVDQ